MSNSPSLLLVDDDPSLGLIVGMLVRRMGLELSCVTTVASAWESLHRQQPELVLLDVNLPGTSGLELLRRLRASADDKGTRGQGDKGRELPSVFLSPCPLVPLSPCQPRVALFCQPAQVDDIAAGWRAGADYLLPKDLVGQPEQWQKRLAEILAHARGQSPPSSLTCPTTASGQTIFDWATALEDMLRHREARRLGPEIPELVLRRAVDQAFASLLSTVERERWIISGHGRLDRRALPRRVPRDSLRLCFASLVDQWRCLLGNEASAPLVEALQAVDDRLSSS